MGMSQFNKILVVCPSGAVTGGPEALHQLVNHMNDLGLSAHIVYLPFDKLDIQRNHLAHYHKDSLPILFLHQQHR